MAEEYTIRKFVPLAPEVNAFRHEFEQNTADITGIVDPLNDDQFLWKPSPDTWSLADCIEHLNTTARNYLPCIDHGIAHAVENNLYSAEGGFEYNAVGRVVVWLVAPPPLACA